MANATQQVTTEGLKPVAKKTIVIDAEVAAKTASDAKSYEIVHEMVGPHRRGEIVDAKAWQDQGVDIARLISVGAVQAKSF